MTLIKGEGVGSANTPGIDIVKQNQVIIEPDGSPTWQRMMAGLEGRILKKDGIKAQVSKTRYPRGEPSSRAWYVGWVVDIQSEYGGVNYEMIGQKGLTSAASDRELSDFGPGLSDDFKQKIQGVKNHEGISPREKLPLHLVGTDISEEELRIEAGGITTFLYTLTD